MYLHFWVEIMPHTSIRSAEETSFSNTIMILENRSRRSFTFLFSTVSFSYGKYVDFLLITLVWQNYKVRALPCFENLPHQTSPSVMSAKIPNERFVKFNTCHMIKTTPPSVMSGILSCHIMKIMTRVGHYCREFPELK